MREPPTGIIKTLPLVYAQRAKPEFRHYQRAKSSLSSDDEAAFYVSMSQRPRRHVLHYYILIDGKIDARFTFAGYEPGNSRRCWDGETRTPAVWATLVGPVEEPPETISMRGFRGFRYTADLW